jgi:hypothetical protein
MRKTSGDTLTKKPVPVWKRAGQLVELIFAVIWEAIKHIDGYNP